MGIPMFKIRWSVRPSYLEHGNPYTGKTEFFNIETASSFRNKHMQCIFFWYDIDGLLQNCSISIAIALEILQSCTKPSICTRLIVLCFICRDYMKYPNGLMWVICSHSSQVLHCYRHDDVIKWKRFPRYWSFVQRIPRWPVNSRTRASDADPWCFLWSAPE